MRAHLAPLPKPLRQHAPARLASLFVACSLCLPAIAATRTGALTVSSSPTGASVTLNGLRLKEKTPCTIPEILAGTYDLEISLEHYRFVKRTVRVLPDTTVSASVELLLANDTLFVRGDKPAGGRSAPQDSSLSSPAADRDGDGFPDSCDKCPDVYGLYDGCPRQRRFAQLVPKLSELRDSLTHDRALVSWTAIGYIRRESTNPRFTRVLNYFNDGKNLMDNYRGLVFGNSVCASFKGASAALELGQWLSGLEFRKPDTICLQQRDRRFALIYDSASKIVPRIYLMSTALSLGIHFHTGRLTTTYSIGRQWEDIVVSQITDRTSGALIDAVFNNDWWFHQAQFDVEMTQRGRFYPSLYGLIRLPISKPHQTPWAVLEAGLALNFPVDFSRGRPWK